MTNNVSSAAIAQALRAIADALEANAPSPATDSDPLLTAGEVRARYGLGRAALDARGVPRVRAGRAYRWRVSDLEAALAAPPPRPRKCRAVEGEDPLEQMLASGELVARGRR